MQNKQLFKYALIVVIVILLSDCVSHDNYNKTPTNPKMIEYSYKKYLLEGKTSCISSKVKNYVGSENCKACHEKQYKTWSRRYMSRFVRVRKDIRWMPFTWMGSPSEIKAKKDEIVLIVGGRNKVALVAKPWQVLPYQYSLKKPGRWKYRSGWDDGSDYRSHCGPCHLTGLDLGTLEFSELGVGCEACHGFGKRHCINPKVNHVYIPKGKEACERCHFQKTKHARKFKFSGISHR